ncbi:MAG: hypothetical protein U9P36_14615 [Thermodesulfobacteriota bacterium]|nr:hypothetical protein [Thermodesulfobacteriota bacterium]
MANKYFTFLLTILLTVSVGSTAVSAGDRQVADLSSQWDSAVSSLLLAAGMYGLDKETNQGTNLSLSQSENLFKGLPFEQGQLDSQNITLSYSGSAGRLGFSAGYIYTSLQDNQEPGTILLDLDALNQNSLQGSNPWYLALDMSKSFQVNENIAVGFGSKAMLMKAPFDDQDGRVISMLLDLPLSYKNYFTITPELQWSRSLPDDESSQAGGNNYSKRIPAEEEDVFYGGMSISFSY